MISRGYRANSSVTGSMNFKKNQDIFFSELRAPGILGPLNATQALELTLQALLWLVKFP